MIASFYYNLINFIFSTGMSLPWTGFQPPANLAIQRHFRKVALSL